MPNTNNTFDPAPFDPDSQPELVDLPPTIPDTNHPVFAEAMVRRGVARSGLTWHFARPPVIDLEYEMDCRRVMREIVV